MLQPTSRIELDNGIVFYEQDVLYDNHIYIGDLDITLNIEYANSGFGIILANSEGNTLSEKKEVLLFKIGNRSAEIIYKNDDATKILGTYNSYYARTHSEKLEIRLLKRTNNYKFYVGDQLVANFNSPVEMNSYNICYYSNMYNVLKDINIAASIPFGWVTNMQNTNGGYIEFKRDSFELSNCKGDAQLEQLDISLPMGTYYLKYTKSEDCDIVPYVFHSEDTRLHDDEKNLLGKLSNKFILPNSENISLKFKGTKGKLSKIYITTEKDNDYIRTSPDKGMFVDIKGSYIKLHVDKLRSASFRGIVNFCPGSDHINPLEYAILGDETRNYGLYDLDLAYGVEYEFVYDRNSVTIINAEGHVVTIIPVRANKILTIFSNINAVINSLIVIDSDGNEINLIVQNTVKKSVPGTVKSPIVVRDQDKVPYDLSASFRRYKKNGHDFYWFTNVEREYFKPRHSIKLSKPVSDKDGIIIAYGVKKESKFDLDKIYDIPKEAEDTVDACCDLYDVLFEKDMRYIDKKTGEIRFNDIQEYKYIIVDYLKGDSYCINYRYDYNSFEVDISSNQDRDINIIYDNTEIQVGNLEFINEELYLKTQVVPTENFYVVLGRE